MALSDDEAVAKVSKSEGFNNHSAWGFKAENLINRDGVGDMVTMETNALIETSMLVQRKSGKITKLYPLSILWRMIV